KRRHHRDAAADECPRDLRREVGALLERARLRAAVERVERLRAGMPWPRRVARRAPVVEHFLAARAERVLLRDRGPPGAERRRRERGPQSDRESHAQARTAGAITQEYRASPFPVS